MKNKTKKLKNPLNPTEQQRIYRNGLWAKALEANKRKARESMRDGHGGRCCLQVAEDVAIECGLDIKRSDYSAEYPSHEVGLFFGWYNTKGYTTNNPRLSYEEDSISASELNDNEYHNGKSKGLPHKEIAKIVRKNFCKKNV